MYDQCPRDKHGPIKAGVVFEHMGLETVDLEYENFKLRCQVAELTNRLETCEARRLDMIQELTRMIHERKGGGY